MSARIIALLTDFGSRDPFVGMMKGVMLGINPQLQLIDISHEITPQRIREAAIVLSVTFPYFPSQTIFVAIIDPGVGGARRPIVVETAEHLFVAPDNGVLGPVLSQAEVRRVVHATETAYFRHAISRTFHGRDVFAPLAAWLSCSVDARHLGAEIEDYVRLELPRPRVLADNALEGEVIYQDRFGNLITNIPESALTELWDPPDWERIQARIETSIIDGLDTYYGQRTPDALGMIINSWGLLEIFANGGNAARATGAVEGSPIRIVRDKIGPQVAPGESQRGVDDHLSPRPSPHQGEG
jgi:S-adenosyl-L-methionine hydrolase (adenosine-forming)